MIAKDLERVIVSTYNEEFKETSDQIVEDPMLSDKFASSVNSKAANGNALDIATINHTLINLRKSGKLRRKSRGYNGRGPNKPR